VLGGKNVVLIGMPGCGKTTLGKRLASELGYSFIDVDDEIEERFGKIPDLFKMGEDYFREKETIATKRVAKNKGIVIATGGGVVLRKENIDALKENGILIYIDRKLDSIMGDVDCDTRPLLKNNKSNLQALYKQRYHLYNKYSDIIINANYDIDIVVGIILDVLREKL
jgi:shikimate kinase